MHVPPFNIPNLRVEQRKTSSAEDMARKNSTGSGKYIFLSTSISLSSVGRYDTEFNSVKSQTYELFLFCFFFGG